MKFPSFTLAYSVPPALRLGSRARERSRRAASTEVRSATTERTERADERTNQLRIGSHRTSRHSRLPRDCPQTETDVSEASLSTRMLPCSMSQWYAAPCDVSGAARWCLGALGGAFFFFFLRENHRTLCVEELAAFFALRGRTVSLNPSAYRPQVLRVVSLAWCLHNHGVRKRIGRRPDPSAHAGQLEFQTWAAASICVCMYVPSSARPARGREREREPKRGTYLHTADGQGGEISNNSERAAPS